MTVTPRERFAFMLGMAKGKLNTETNRETFAEQMTTISYELQMNHLPKENNDEITKFITELTEGCNEELEEIEAKIL